MCELKRLLSLCVSADSIFGTQAGLQSLPGLPMPPKREYNELADARLTSYDGSTNAVRLFRRTAQKDLRTRPRWRNERCGVNQTCQFAGVALFKIQNALEDVQKATAETAVFSGSLAAQDRSFFLRASDRQRCTCA